MCVVSAVMIHYEPRIPCPDRLPWYEPYPRGPYIPDSVPGPPAIPTPLAFVAPSIHAADLVAIRKLLDEFREAVAAAKTVDRLTGQPDCVDPEKAKLEQRVAELERRLDALEKARYPRRNARPAQAKGRVKAKR